MAAETGCDAGSRAAEGAEAAVGWAVLGADLAGLAVDWAGFARAGLGWAGQAMDEEKRTAAMNAAAKGVDFAIFPI
jgi:maltoporin